jgi:uncharacterized protein (DUF1778 family)
MMPASQHRAQKVERLNIRATPEEKELIELAARAGRTTFSRFVLDAALQSAEEALADQTRFVVSRDQWARLVAMLDRPSRTIPALAEAATRPSPLGEC